MGDWQNRAGPEVPGVQKCSPWVPRLDQPVRRGPSQSTFDVAESWEMPLGGQAARLRLERKLLLSQFPSRHPKMKHTFPTNTPFESGRGLWEAFYKKAGESE